MFNFWQNYLVATPDYGHSDIWHFNFALKFLYSQALSAGYLPFWSKNIGTGFPLLGEGQIGLFFLPNLLLFKLFPATTAFSLAILFCFLLAISGTYYLARTARLPRLAAIFFAATFSLSGGLVTQINHLNLLQAISLLPWLFVFVEKIFQSDQKRWVALLALFYQQQIFAGFQQSVLISTVGVGVYVLARFWQHKDLSKLVRLIMGLVLGIILALPQILPTLELVQHSFRQTGLSTLEVAQFPFEPKNLLALINPYFFGDPRIGTYPRFSSEWGIFWESTPYFSVVGLLLFLYSLLKYHHVRLIQPFIPITAAGLILMLGEYSPFFFLFQMPPLSFFRVPGRFLILFVLGATWLASYALSKISRQTIRYLLLLIMALDLGHFALSYHSFINPTEWLAEPATVKLLRSDPNWYRVYSPIPVDEWNKIFEHTGWSNMAAYRQFRNALDPNQNLYWNIPTVNFYTGIANRRSILYQSIIGTGFTLDKSGVNISPNSAKLLNLAGTGYLILPQTLANPNNFLFIATVAGRPNFYVYKNPRQYPHAYLTTNYVIANDVPDLLAKLSDASQSAAVVEELLPFPSKSAPITEAVVLVNSDLEVIVQATSSEPALLILSDSFYPGWKATANNTPTRIFPVNLNQRAVLVPKGQTTLRFVYQPLKFF